MATCPACGTRSREDHEAITITAFLKAKPIGTWSLAGAQLKTVAYEQLRMSCRCGWSIEGYIDPAAEQFCGYPDTQVWPEACPEE